MVDVGNFVDGEVPRWDAGEDDLLGVDVTGVVVYHPEISMKAFERSVLRLADRAATRTRNILNAARPARNGFRIIDSNTIAEADKTCEQIHGYDYLDHFMTDTTEVAATEIGGASVRARASGVKVLPERGADAVSVRPARSFSSLDELKRWERGIRVPWRPSVRLEVRVSLDGPLCLVEEAAEDLRRALARCGPVTFFEEHARQTRDGGPASAAAVLLPSAPGLDSAG